MKVASALLFVSLSIFSVYTIFAEPPHPYSGRWELLNRNAGVSAMHMALLPNSRVVAYDRTNMGPSNISLPNGRCESFSPRLPLDCTAHSIEINPSDGSVRPLTLLSDTWCSSGALSLDGVLVQSGGFLRGANVVRYFDPKVGDWREVPWGLIRPRWYASNQILPDGKIIVVGGLNELNYEFIPKTSASDYVLYDLPFLNQTREDRYLASPNNLYPFTHLSPDGNLFIFANDHAILFDYVSNKVVRQYPTIPGGFSRNYPSTGSSVLLPLKLSSDGNAVNNPEAEVLVCGGTLPYAFQLYLTKRQFLPATNTCGRLKFTAQNPRWEMEEMPIIRTMGDMILLPTGDVLIINGASKGSAGWSAGRVPVLNPVLYRPGEAARVKNSSRFEVLSPAWTPRMYHSTAILLADGRVLVGGSNPHRQYNFTGLFPTTLSFDAFHPPYLGINKPRPGITSVQPGNSISYKQKFSIGFKLNEPKAEEQGKTYVTMVAPCFTTHSFAMNQRLLVLTMDKVYNNGTASTSDYVAEVNAPATAALAPPGYYLLFVVQDGVPSEGVWVHISVNGK